MSAKPISPRALESLATRKDNMGWSGVGGTAPDHPMLSLRPYDPTKPANGAPIVSAELRNHFAGLKLLIDGRTSPADVSGQIFTEAACNCSGVNELGLTVADPPTQAQVKAITNELDELIAILRRV